jgi:hypothetical protein
MFRAFNSVSLCEKIYDAPKIPSGPEDDDFLKMDQAQFPAVQGAMNLLDIKQKEFCSGFVATTAPSQIIQYFLTNTEISLSAYVASLIYVERLQKATIGTYPAFDKVITRKPDAGKGQEFLNYFLVCLWFAWQWIDNDDNYYITKTLKCVIFEFKKVVQISTGLTWKDFKQMKNLVMKELIDVFWIGPEEYHRVAKSLVSISARA